MNDMKSDATGTATGTPILYAVLPCYNESAVIEDSAAIMKGKMESLVSAGRIAPESRIVFVNDGSKDDTMDKIAALHAQSEIFVGIGLTRNYGHQAALMAGMTYAAEHADAVVTLDADLQDDLNAIDEMLEQYNEGCDLVLGVRSSRDVDTGFKRNSTETGYKLLRLLGVDITFNHSDFRLVSRRFLETFSGYREVNLFLRGMITLVGYKVGKVYYERKERIAGQPTFTNKRLLGLAWDGVTSFSVRPIRIIILVGLITFLVSIGMLIYIFALHFTGGAPLGWASTMTSIWAFGGLQLLAIGIIGEYVGKTYMEAKHRPRYNVERIMDR